MLDDYIGLTPDVWKQLKPQLKSQTQEQQIDTLIKHIDPEQKMPQNEFETAAKPYFDKLDDYTLKSNVKQTIKDIINKDGKTLFYDWILTGLTKKLEKKVGHMITANTDYQREKAFVPQIDAPDTATNNVLQHFGSEASNSSPSMNNLSQQTNNNLINQRIPNELDYIGDDYTEPLDIDHVPLTPIKEGEMIEPKFVKEYTYRDVNGNVINTQRLRPTDEYLQAMRHGFTRYRRDPVTGFMITQNDLIAADRERNTSTGSPLVDRIVDVASPRYRHELRTNELLREITEYEYTMTQAYYSHFMNKHKPEKVFNRSDVPLTKAFNNVRTGDLSLNQLMISDEAWNNAIQTQSDVERQQMIEVMNDIGAEPSMDSEYALTDEQKRDILNAARNKYIELAQLDVKEARSHLAYNIGQHILSILALKPYLRIGLKTAIAMIEHIPDKSKASVWDKVYNIFLDSGVIPFVAIRKMKQLFQHLPTNVAASIFRFFGRNINTFMKYTGIDYVKRIIEKATSFLPNWTGLNLDFNSRLGTGIEDMNAKFQSTTIAAKLQLNNVRAIIKGIKRHLKHMSNSPSKASGNGNEPQLTATINVKTLEKEHGMKALMKERNRGHGMKALMKERKSNQSDANVEHGLKALMRKRK